MMDGGRGGRGRVSATAISSARNLVAGGLVLLAISVSACSAAGKVRSAFGGRLPLKVTIAPGANDDTAIAVDFVVVYSDKLLDEIMKVSAADWFAKKSRFLADHPQELMVEAREWVPGQPVAPWNIQYRAGAKKIVVFADYLVPGDHRATLDPQQPFRLVLGQSELRLEELR